MQVAGETPGGGSGPLLLLYQESKSNPLQMLFAFLTLKILYVWGVGWRRNAFFLCVFSFHF